MRERRANCLLLLLLLMMTVTDQTPGVSASLMLRGRWVASIDEADTSAGDIDHQRALIHVLRDHQGRHHPATGPHRLQRLLSTARFSQLLGSEIANRLQQAFEHQVGNPTG